MFVIGGRFYRASRPTGNSFQHLKSPASACRPTPPVQVNAIVQQVSAENWWIAAVGRVRLILASWSWIERCHGPGRVPYPAPFHLHISLATVVSNNSHNFLIIAF